MDIVITFGC